MTDMSHPFTYDDPRARESLMRLFDSAWPQLRGVIADARAFGVEWADTTTPFVRFEDGRAVAHVGVLAIPMVIAGRKRTVAGVHAVVTDPAYRGRGYARDLLTEACAFIDKQYDSALLCAVDPNVYVRHGFRALSEQVFTTDVRTPVYSSEGTHAARRLSPNTETDRALLLRLLGTRSAVSETFASLDPGWLFVTDALLWRGAWDRFFYIDDLDVIVVAEQKGTTLRLFDIVGTAIPPLELLLRYFPTQIDRVKIHFTPDNLAVRDIAHLPLPPQSDIVMLRGIDEPLGVAMLPLLAHC